MKMKMKGGVIEDDASVAGLFDCTMKYEISNTKATIDWKGPKIPLEMWNEVLSFFQWCYDTYNSECQVRLYVSPTLQTWKAYAYPQEAKTGMTAHELDNEAKREQHAALGLQPPDWFAFGTVHHHCSAGAFQSGTDRDNEESQDGLHITIGHLSNKDSYDIHARFYRKGLVLKDEVLDMSWFMDTAPILAECPEKFRPYLPKDWANKTARRLLTTPPTELVFPKQWSDNVIEVKPTVSPYVSQPSSIPAGGTGWGGTEWGGPSQYSSETEPLWKRVQSAWKEILYKAAAEEVQPEDLESAMKEMALQGFAYHILCMACRHHRVDPDDIERQAPPDLLKAITEETLLQQQEKNVEPTLPKSEASVAEGSAKKDGGAGPAGGIDDRWPYDHYGM